MRNLFLAVAALTRVLNVKIKGFSPDKGDDWPSDYFVVMSQSITITDVPPSSVVARKVMPGFHIGYRQTLDLGYNLARRHQNAARHKQVRWNIITNLSPACLPV